MGGYNLPPNRIGGIRDIGSFVVGPSHSGVVHDCLDSAIDTAELNTKLMMVFRMQNGISYRVPLVLAHLGRFWPTSRPKWFDFSRSLLESGHFEITTITSCCCMLREKENESGFILWCPIGVVRRHLVRSALCWQD
jgi:hypothetical protein